MECRIIDERWKSLYNNQKSYILGFQGLKTDSLKLGLCSWVLWKPERCRRQKKEGREHRMEEQKNPRERDRQTAPSCQPQRVLRLTDLLYVVHKRRILIVLCAVIGLVVGAALSVVPNLRGEMSKRYAITSSIAVTSQDQNGLFTAQSNSPNSNDIYLAENMVDAVIYVMKSERTLTAAIDRLELPGVTTKDISRSLSMTQYNDTQIIEVTLYWRSAHEGVEILKAMNAVAPDILVSTLKIGNVSVINPPTARALIGGGLNAMLLVYTVLMGTLLGVGFAVMELLLRPTLLKTDDMEWRYHVEVLGEIPGRSSYFREKRNLLTQEDDDRMPEILDSYICLAHILKSRLSKLRHPCVSVTSAAQGEGRTTVTAYLAAQLAEIGMKVLVVDLDTRNPKLGGLFLSEVDDTHSINALYRGDAPREEAITHLTANLDILPAVPERMPLDEPLLNILSGFKQDYDIVLMDTAPVGLAAETMRLNQLADGALLVVRFDGASLDLIQDALGRLEKSGMEVMGCVVNGIKKPTGGMGDCSCSRSNPHRNRNNVQGEKRRTGAKGLETDVGKRCNTCIQLQGVSAPERGNGDRTDL